MSLDRPRTMGGLLFGGAVASTLGLKAYSLWAVRQAQIDFPPPGQVVTVDDVHLHYLARGVGRPVVLLHASGLVLRDFTYSIFDRVAASYRAIAFDRPGYGYSERPPDEPLSLGGSARLIHEALALSGVEQPILIGHSGGGSVALRYALDYPDAVAGLVLVAPSAYGQGLSLPPLFYLTDLPVVGPFFLHTLLAPLVQIVAPQFVAGLFAPNAPPAGYVDMIRAAALRPGHFRTHADELKHLRADLREQSPHYGEIRMPVVILAGAADQVSPPETQAHLLQHAIPHAQLVVLPETGHALHHAQPAAVMEAIQKVDRARRSVGGTVLRTVDSWLRVLVSA